MRIEWLNKTGTDQVILFFNGWGMDAAAVSHLKKESDLLMLNDYRECQGIGFPGLQEYRDIVVVAWSMGVWAAGQVLSQLPFKPSVCVALNGTGYPVDDHYGIPAKIYELTEKGMNHKGREKFFQRMLTGEEEWIRFATNRPSRELSEQCEELGCIRRESVGSSGSANLFCWDKAYISEKDIIVPEKHQWKYWKEKVVKIISLEGGHYPFYHFRSWQEIIEG